MFNRFFQIQTKSCFYKMNSFKFADGFKKTYDKLKMQGLPKTDIPDQTVKFGQIKTPPKDGTAMALPTIPPRTLINSLGFHLQRPPVSAYYNMKVKDTMYHVFNASRISLGRMSAKIAYVIQGKGSPLTVTHRVSTGDKIIIVNAKHVKLTGKKLLSKIYYSHSTYPGGLKQITAKDYLLKNPTEMILKTIKGMLPKNKLRKEQLTKIIIYDEAGHDLYHLGLPQFSPIIPVDYDSLLGRDITKETHEIIGSTEDIANLPERYKGFKVNIHEDTYKPDQYLEQPADKLSGGIMRYYNKIKERHNKKWNKRIRNMGYRYI